MAKGKQAGLEIKSATWTIPRNSQQNRCKEKIYMVKEQIHKETNKGAHHGSSRPGFTKAMEENAYREAK